MLTANQTPATKPGVWRLPQTETSQSAGLNDRRGMTLAMNQVKADLRGMGSGGGYLDAPAGHGGLTIGAEKLAYFAGQSFDFIFSPLNTFSAGSYFLVTTGNSGWFPKPCPAEPADLRPYFLAMIQPGGNMEMLARLDSYTFSACGNVIILGPGGP